ncbi:transposase [Streptomyces sp. G-G2]|uniref:transposase n=1 Tax=Streptomyces sp. G-G2 TaxID=3046201 RepID=UPI0024B963C2|nr:transposase [Streptomyces sp. G-G2]
MEWTVERHEPHLGRVVVVDPAGARQQLTFRFLVNHPACRPSSRTAADGPDRGRQSASVADLPPGRLELVRLRMAHLLEVGTGFRSGNPEDPGPGEPRPCYDPAVTTLTERRWAKVAELGAMDRQEARLLGLDRVGYRTLIRWERGRERSGLIGCADDRWLRPGGRRPSIGPEIREAIFAVHAELQGRSRVGMATRTRLIHQYVRETYGPDLHVPSYNTLRQVWHEWFGPSGSRPRNLGAADLPVRSGHVLVDRPGQVVALDTTVLPVMVREGVFGEPVRAHLTLALDVFTHSLCAFRLTLVSDTAVDAAMLLRDVMLPLPMRPEWGPEMEWPYPGLPSALVAEFAGHPVAGLPFFSPETVTTDHGSVYRNHHLVEVERRLGCNILPARALRPPDKHAVERAFGAIRTLLFEHLPGYTGVDAADRGAAPEDEEVLTLEEMEHLVATWIVGIWQRRHLGEYAPAWDVGGNHSPNTLFAASFEQTGLGLRLPQPDLYYELLPSHPISVLRERGVKIKGLWYYGDALEPYLNERSARGGRFKGRWCVHREPRDRRTVFFQDPLTHDWHELRWTGLPPVGTVPAFGDRRVSELLAAAREADMRPRTDAELLPLLLEILAARAPVSSWKTATTRSERINHARDETQARAAAEDRAAAPAPVSPVTPMPQRVEQAVSGLDAERRHRREEAVTRRPTKPARLGTSYRTGNLFLLPEDDTDHPQPDPPDEGA